MVNGERVPNEHFLEWEGYNFAAEFAPRKRGYQVYANGSVHHSGQFWSVEDAVAKWYGRGADHNRLKDRQMSDRTTIYTSIVGRRGAVKTGRIRIDIGA
jgi:phage terminase large subunit-like protein